MRLNTRKRYNLLKYVYPILGLMLFSDLLMVQFEGSFGRIDWIITRLSLLMVLLLWYRGNPVFRYDSDGEVLVIESSEPTLGKLFRSNRLYEFPKRKLAGYRIVNWPFRKKLLLEVQSKDKKIRRLKISISYLTRQELRDMKRSLDSILLKNTTRKQSKA